MARGGNEGHPSALVTFGDQPQVEDLRACTADFRRRHPTLIGADGRWTQSALDSPLSAPLISERRMQRSIDTLRALSGWQTFLVRPGIAA